MPKEKILYKGRIEKVNLRIKEFNKLGWYLSNAYQRISHFPGGGVIVEECVMYFKNPYYGRIVLSEGMSWIDALEGATKRMQKAFLDKENWNFPDWVDTDMASEQVKELKRRVMRSDDV